MGCSGGDRPTGAAWFGTALARFEFLIPWGAGTAGRGKLGKSVGHLHWYLLLVPQGGAEGLAVRLWLSEVACASRRLRSSSVSMHIARVGAKCIP
jgi:hypothetical protein